MKKAITLFSATLLLFTVSCNNSVKKENEEEVLTETEIVEENDMDMAINTEAVTADIDPKREMIESNLSSPVEVSTTNLREKVKQKWSKIHYYTKDGQVVRIKTYPHENVSKRTEEFYFENGELILAVIEDDGSADAANEGELDKMYYYNEGKVINEVNNESETETEYNDKESDAEELRQEAKEYMDIYKQQAMQKK